MEHQARIVKSLLDQLESQEAVDEEEPNGIAGEFARLKSQSTKYRAEKTYPTKTAEQQANIKKNRYKDIVPFDHSRVKLTTSKNNTDYINASFIKGVTGSRAYIATQGPLPHTVQDFLRMVWEYNVKVIVMACREFEMGKKKCERYWPLQQEQPFVCDAFTVYCNSEENKGDYLTRTLQVTYCNSSRTLKQLHYVNWPDHGVPDSIPPILEMLDEMRSTQEHDEIPICIHCSAGCGRTGVLCVIDYTWNLLKKQMITPDFCIFSLVQNMRTQRPSVVQTKEQYDLVYRTIKVLFERYLQSTAVHLHRNEMTVVPSAITPDTESELSDLSEDLDLLPHLQHLLDKERHVLSQQHTPFLHASENLLLSGAQRDQQHWNLLHNPSEARALTQDIQEGIRTTPKLLHTISQRTSADEDRMQESDDIPSLNPPPSPAAAICLMVEDPYFDTPLGSPSSEEAPVDSTKDDKEWTASSIFGTPSLSLNDQNVEINSSASGIINTDEEAPPPLPQRTPESYMLAIDAGTPDPTERLMVIIPPNAAAEAVRELGGAPPSPVPPLPERTPESFELAVDQASVDQRSEFTPAVNLNRIGVSSEWSGNSESAATASHNEMKPWVRSKSLKAKMTFTVAHPDLASNTPSNLYPYCPPPLHPVTPPPPPQTEESLTPPLPDRTPASFILTTDHISQSTALLPQPSETIPASQRVGLSSEWDGTHQPKKFLDVVMNRSKSVRAKSSRQEHLTVIQQLNSPTVVVAEGGSARVGQQDVNRRPSLSTDTPGNKSSDKSHEKGMLRTRSLKFFRHRQKSKSAPPPPPSQIEAPPPSFGASSSVFKFGFGNRFGKPKGPRGYPETWV